MHNKFSAILGLFLCLISQGAFAQTKAVVSTSGLGMAMDKLATIEGFSSSFKQVITYSDGGERVYTGSLAILRPGHFRWHYHKPYEQLYVSNGDGIWLYEPDLLQAQRLQDLGEVDPIVLQLLDGRVSLNDIVVLAEETLADGATSWHISVGSIKNAVEIWVGTQDKTLVWIESRDVLANRNRLFIIDMNFVKPNKDIFEFIAPEGVDVIGAIQ